MINSIGLLHISLGYIIQLANQIRKYCSLKVEGKYECKVTYLVKKSRKKIKKKLIMVKSFEKSEQNKKTKTFS